MSEWITLFEERYGARISIQGDLTIQNWLADQSTQECGCPLIDNPFIFEVEDDNTV